MATHQHHAVYFRQFATDAWDLQAHVFCDNFSFVAGPDVAEATLHFEYGFIEPEGEAAYVSRGPKDVNGWYVKVVLNQFTADDTDTVRTWFGVIVETTNDRRGLVTSKGAKAESGAQIFHCRGYEFFLQRTIVDSSFVLDTDGNEIEIGRAIAFNLGPGRDNDNARNGNKSASPGERDAPIFAFEIGVGGIVATEKTWAVQDIITYLLHYHPPRNAFDADNLNWTSPDGGDAEVLSKLYPTVHAQGKSVKQLFDELIDRRRLVGYTINIEGDGDHPKVDVFTFNPSDVTLPGGTFVPGNANQQTWYFDDDPNITSAIVSEDDATRFDVVIVRGAPLASCFTIGNDITYNKTLVKDWADDLQTSYNTGASTSGAYAAMASYDKASANQAFRADDIFAKVFRGFLLKTDFDGMTVGGDIVCPDPSKEGDSGEPSTEVSPFWYPGLRFLDRLPLRTDFDYMTVADLESTSQTLTSSQPNYLRPFAVARVRTDTGTSPLDETNSVCYRLDRPGQGKLSDELLKTLGRTWAAHLRAQDDCPGLLIDVQGAAQHMIADDEFQPVDDDDENDEEAQIRWQDIACTVFCEFDQHAEAKYPDGELTSDTDVVRELIIDEPRFRLDYLVPDTIVAVGDDGQPVTTDGGYVRDDRALMQDMARCAFEWYGHTRKALTITQRNLICDRSIGELITTIGSIDTPVEVNSVITKIVFDIRAGTVTVHTQYAELDPVRNPN